MKFAINGFGRIGRTACRVWFEKHADQHFRFDGVGGLGVLVEI